MQSTIDVSGLPEPVVNDIRQLVATLRSRLSPTGGAPPPAGETPEEWVRRLTAWVEGHPKRAIDFDDSRDGIYAGNGE